MPVSVQTKISGWESKAMTEDVRTNRNFQQHNHQTQGIPHPKPYKNYQNWKIASINVRTGDEKGQKIQIIANEANRAGIDILGIQELRYGSVGNEVIEVGNDSFEFHYAGYEDGSENSGQAGVGFLIRRCRYIEIGAVECSTVMQARILAVSVKIKGYSVKVVTGYSPTDTPKYDSAKNIFWNELNKMSKLETKKQQILVIGDLNATTELSTRVKPCFYNGKKAQNLPDPECLPGSNGFRLKNFCKINKLCISNTHFTHRRLHRWTWYSPCDENDKKKKAKQIRKCLDYVLASQLNQRFMLDCRVYRGYNFESDHKLLVSRMRTPTTKAGRFKRKKPENPNPKVNLKTLQITPTRKIYTSQIEPTSDQDIDIANERLISSLKQAATETLPKKKKKTKRSIYGHDKVLQDLLQRRVKTKPNSKDWKILKKKISERIKYLKNRFLNREATAMNEAMKARDIEELFRICKDDEKIEVKSKVKCDNEKLKAFYRDEHFNLCPPSAPPQELSLEPAFIHQLREISKNTPITTGSPDLPEICSILKKLKNNKSSNDIAPELMKYATNSENFTSSYKKLLDQIWETKNLPKSYSHSRMTCLWKGAQKGTWKEPKNYRPLQVGSTLAKILCAIILERLSPWFESQLLDQQQGFRSSRGTNDGLFIVKRVQQISSKTKTPIYSLFVDLTAAFDKVNRQFLFESISRRFDDGKNNNKYELFEILEKLYQHTTTALSDTPEDTFELRTGVRQGGPESPFLYNLYMDWVMRCYMDECERKGIYFPEFQYRVNDTIRIRGQDDNKGFHRASWVGYADDLVIFLKNETDVRLALKLLDEVFKRYQLTINVSKTKSMIFNFDTKKEEYPTSIAKLNGQTVENVEKFKYLGDQIVFNEPSTGDTEIHQRCNSAQGAFHQFRSKFKNFKIDLKIRVQLLNATVRSRMTYGCQIWNLTELQSKRISSQYIRFLRGLLPNGFTRKKKKKDEFALKLTNQKVLKICGCEPLEDFILRLQTKYLAHLARTPNNTMAKQLLFNIDDNKKAGRPVPTLEEQVVKKLYQSKPGTLYDHKRYFYEHAKNRTEDSLLPKSESTKNKHKKKVHQHRQSKRKTCWSEAGPSAKTARRC